MGVAALLFRISAALIPAAGAMTFSDAVRAYTGAECASIAGSCSQACAAIPEHLAECSKNCLQLGNTCITTGQWNGKSGPAALSNPGNPPASTGNATLPGKAPPLSQSP